ncbi:MAG TPA: tRNA pseudouridine(13) synthase TruD [Acidiferrobacterales bacterium]|nr:tRNA pseudouridine(13) synthase TruD [Acidiferrobacterales bacterium]
MNPLPVWPRTAVPPLSGALLRARPEDFQVEEDMPFALSGAGEHLWLRVRKRGYNSEQVAKQLARTAGVTRREVGYAGMKDRHAITVQWFSLHLAARPDPDWGSLPDGMEVVESMRHSRKLKTGALAGNRFIIVLRDCLGDPGAVIGAMDFRDAVLRRSEEIHTHGLPNYFGEQRFGHGGGNVAAARAMFAGSGSVRDRKQGGIYLSAARSLVFNEVLARRVTAGTWDQALDGDAMILNGSRSFFVPEIIDETIWRRLAEGDIHPSGPLWGRGDLPTKSAVRELEAVVASEHPDLVHGLEAAGLEQERRALRVIPQEFNAQWLDASTLSLAFVLPPGSYATMLLRELADYRDGATAAWGEEPA